MSDKKEHIIKIEDFDGGYVEFKNPTIRQTEILEGYKGMSRFIDLVYNLHTTLPNDQEFGNSIRSTLLKIMSHNK